MTASMAASLSFAPTPTILESVLEQRELHRGTVVTRVFTGPAFRSGYR